ncbi:hypothetical protein [Streptomyces capitiformicae]|uniref:Uncharacterized protein n=1 Tax=Streptomyces capitiformicae TaxID=2014920 RepID=A0A919GPR1_9ACTN|nr:hypothetical protein [Streptomyces capitiformicae]GHH87630.1 hypothetical protein GCM10017771_29650 [Streptomyces capitiformicae]
MDENTPDVVTVADDDILANRILPGIRALREHLGCSLQEALIMFTERYEVLRVERPDEFSQPRDEYWNGFYS